MKVKFTCYYVVPEIDSNGEYDVYESDIINVIKDTFFTSFNYINTNFEKYLISDLELEMIKNDEIIKIGDNDNNYERKSINFFISSEHSIEQCTNMLNDINDTFTTNSSDQSIFFGQNGISMGTWLSENDNGECSHILESKQFILFGDKIKELLTCKKCSESFYKNVKEL